jgi:hypothetical protein
MASMTLGYGATSVSAACGSAVMAVRDRHGVSPIASVQGTSVPFAGPITARLAAHAAQTQNVVDRKADGWVPPRGRTL